MLVFLAAHPSQNKSHPAILWQNTGAAAALKEGPAPQGAAETPAPAHAGGGKIGRGAFFTPQTAAPPICGWDGAFSYLLISPSCCPMLATGTAPPSPPQPQAGSGSPSFYQGFHFPGCSGGNNVASQAALTRILLLLLRHLHLALQEGGSRWLHLRCWHLQ